MLGSTKKVTRNKLVWMFLFPNLSSDQSMSSLSYIPLQRAIFCTCGSEQHLSSFQQLKNALIIHLFNSLHLLLTRRPLNQYLLGSSAFHG